MKKQVLFFIINFCFLQFLTSQTIEVIEGREFIVHHVKNGETIYGISQNYDVPSDTILAYNVSVKTKKIKPNQVLKFPSRNSINNSSIRILNHIVTYGETLYGIAKKYNVTIADIEKANSQIKDQVIKVGDVLKIIWSLNNTANNNNENEGNIVIKVDTARPVITKIIPDTIVINCDTIKPNKKSFKIALILPFRGNNLASTKIATEFYYGFKVAIDSVASKMKVAVKLYVINSSASSDSDKVEDLYDFDKLKQMDMIIGPLFASSIKPIAQFAKENKIPIVSPFTKSMTLLENNPYVIKITPSEKTLAKRTLTYFNTTFPGCNFILMKTKSTARDSVLHAGYSQALDELGIADSTRIHKISSGSSPSSFFKGGVKNVVIYMNSRETTVKSFITGFNKGHKSGNISLVGTEGWLEFNNVEADYYRNLNLHIPVATYADFTDSTKYEYFIRRYQSAVKSDPTDYSFTGFKIGSDLMSRFFNYSPYLCNCIDQQKEIIDEKLKPPFTFYFERKTENDGWENNAIQILRVEDEYILDILNY